MAPRWYLAFTLIISLWFCTPCIFDYNCARMNSLRASSPILGEWNDSRVPARIATLAQIGDVFAGYQKLTINRDHTQGLTLTANAKLQFALNGFTSPAVHFWDLRFAGAGSRRPSCLFSFIHSLLFYLRNCLEKYVFMKKNWIFNKRMSSKK